MLVKQFHLPLTYKDVPSKWEKNANVRKTILSLQTGQEKRITWKDYIPTFNLKTIKERWNDNDVAIALNGSKVKCLNRTKDSITVQYTVLTDFYPCRTVIMGILTPEGLFDYLEKKNIISTPVGTIVKTYPISELMQKAR